ncbi:MAG: FliM/FliN family flagellar motor switch protein [Bacteroidota bacterium]
MEAELPKSQPGRVKYVTAYDFKQPKLFSKEIMRTLKSIHDILSRNLSRIFSTALRYKVEINLNTIMQLATPEYLASIQSPSINYLMKLPDLAGEIVVHMPSGFGIHLIERQSGGQTFDFSEKRTLTLIEEKIMNRVMDNIKKEIVSAWEAYTELEVASNTYESKPENLHLASLDPTIIARFAVNVGEKLLPLEVSYSYSLLKNALSETILKQNISSKLEKLNEEEKEAYERTLSQAGVMIQPLLGTATLSLHEILNLKEGDTIPLYQKSDLPLDVKVNGKVKMTGYPGQLQGRRAVKIYSLIDKINELELV